MTQSRLVRTAGFLLSFCAAFCAGARGRAAAAAPSSLDLATGFVEPMVPTAPSSKKEDEDLARAINSYRDRAVIDDLRPLEALLATHPRSVWQTAILTNLGLSYLTMAIFHGGSTPGSKPGIRGRMRLNHMRGRWWIERWENSCCCTPNSVMLKDWRNCSTRSPIGQSKNYQYALDDRLAGIGYQKALNPTPNVGFTYDPYFPRGRPTEQARPVIPMFRSVLLGRSGCSRRRVRCRTAPSLTATTRSAGSLPAQ
jgi:hypothetical protein